LNVENRVKKMERLGILIEGKTKIIWGGVVIIESKNSITAGDGIRKDEIEGKGKFSNETTCNCFPTCRSPTSILCYTLN